MRPLRFVPYVVWRIVIQNWYQVMAKEEGGEIPAIALTLYAGESDRDQVLAVEFQKHVAKPV